MRIRLARVRHARLFFFLGEGRGIRLGWRRGIAAARDHLVLVKPLAVRRLGRGRPTSRPSSVLSQGLRRRLAVPLSIGKGGTA